ncbi:reverse transcriptase domain-containing protein [Tanacetum coccineum]
MRTRSSLEYTIPRRRNRRRSRQQQEAIPIVDKFPIQMADDRPMAEQLQAPTGGFESAIVVPLINAQNFELKSSLINLVQNRIFRGGNDEEPHAHIRHFESITNNQRYPDVPNTTIKLLLFPFSLDGVAKTWLDKEPPNSILTWDDLVSKFINFFFPPSKTTNLRNEITNFRQIAQESFSEAWERFKELLRKCPHHGERCTSNALDALDVSSVIIESNGTESQKQDTSSRSGNDGHNAEQCHDTCPLPAKLTDDKTTELSNQSLESENVCLKKTVAQCQKDFAKLKAYCINLEIQMKDNVLKSGQQSQFLKEKSNEAKVKNDIDIQKKGFAIAALKNELRKLTGNSVNTKFAKPSILGKPVGQTQNQSVVRQPTAFKSERPKISKERFASQVDVTRLNQNSHYTSLPKEENLPSKPDHIDCTRSSRSSSKTLYSLKYRSRASVFMAMDVLSIRQFIDHSSSLTSDRTTVQNAGIQDTAMTVKFKAGAKSCSLSKTCQLHHDKLELLILPFT